MRILIILALLGLNISCDQVSKKIARQSIEYNEHISLNNYLTLTKVENTGAFLSLGHSLPNYIRTLLLTIIPVIVLLFATFYLLTRKNLTNLIMIGISFVIGGGIGNIYDRIVYGSVTDFLHIDFVVFQTGIFNMADVSIMIGMGILILQSFFNLNREEGANSE